MYFELVPIAENEIPPFGIKVQGYKTRTAHIFQKHKAPARQQRFLLV